MFRKAGVTREEGLKRLKECGLGSMPGGGAEIFDDEIRTALCPEKGPAELWLDMHEAAHKAGIPTNATILYGHIENESHRLSHLELLRNLQDRTGGFQAFIPLKFRKANNFLSELKELTRVEDMKTFAISRIFLDNIKNLKVYWPMIGREASRILLQCGANDIDGTIANSTKIYSMAGAEEQAPSMTVSELHEIIRGIGRLPVERDSLYNSLD
jgi:aminodeoxyfutalosine synthase